LIETTTELLKTLSREEISSEMILNESGISKGSMYHHFEDLDHLIEHAMLRRYADWVDSSIVGIQQVLTTGNSPEDIYAAAVQMTTRTQDPAMKTERMYRAEILGMASHSPRFAKQLSLEQQRLTDSLTDLIREVQERGFFSKDQDPRAIAVFIQAYTLGKVVDDFSDNPMNPENWNYLVNTVIRKVFSPLN
jgi:AcrR family transcriptional regulator